MDNILSHDVLYGLDIIKIRSGEILSLCGSFQGPWCRARLAFYPCPESSRLIQERPYQKASYETGYLIPGFQKILDLPGEQHFLVHRSQIIKVYKATEAFRGLSGKTLEDCQLFKDLLYQSCRLDRNHHGLTGSGALHCILSTSDFDWVIYERDPTAVKNYVVSSGSFKRELTFEMAHAYKKYSVFTGLTQTALDALFRDRWKDFRFRDLRISVSFVDPLFWADNFLDIPNFSERIVIEGTVVDAVGCYHLPRIIRLRCRGEECLVLTWLFLYNGAFSIGDVVEVSGRRCAVKGSQYILIESTQDYVRKAT